VLELEPFDALTLTLHHAPGSCALLLGSGLSRSAGIPTGWEITLDLVRRVAAVRGEDAGDDPAAWCRQALGVEPDYSTLLDAAASTPDERRSILQSYIEARDGEEGRQPTAAHRAIARLVARGAVRVIITTNFDRLLEQALAGEGIQPTVISSDDTLDGAIPLIQSRCTIVKIHGDYMDTRIRNTAPELEHYTKKLNRLLHQIFDDHGLVVCGWSGEWDHALRKSIERVKSRRYPTYWASRTEPSAAAGDLIAMRKARVVKIDGADTFFVKLETTLSALAEDRRPHPTSVRMLIDLGKRLCLQDAQQVAWADLLFHEAQTAQQKFAQSPNYANGGGDDGLRSYVEDGISATERLRRLMLVCGRWGSQNTRKECERTLLRFASARPTEPTWGVWAALQRIPASLCFYWYCAGALAAEDFKTVKRVFSLVVADSNGPRALLEIMPPSAYSDVSSWKFLNSTTKWVTPVSHYLAPIFEREASDIAYTSDEGAHLFDELEALIAMEFGHCRLLAMEEGTLGGFWSPMGRFRLREDYGSRLLSFENLPKTSPHLSAGFFAGERQRAAAAVDALRRWGGALR